VTPSGPPGGSVAPAATLDNAINLREVNLIGIYGGSGDRRALVRMGNGRYVRVTVGDQLDGGRVTAISAEALNYSKRGRAITLRVAG
jgi:type IV pilus biogenesis protein PilP